MGMRLCRECDRYRLDAERRCLTVAQAVERECIDDGYGSGAVEQAASTADATARLVARLVEQLHTTGALSDAAVLEVLGGRFFVVEEGK